MSAKLGRRTFMVRHLAGRAAEADVVVPEAGGRLQTLHAVYGKACLPAMERRLRAGQLTVTGVIDDVRVVRVPADAVAHYADPELAFMNLNTPEELAHARALWDRRSGHAARGASTGGGRGRGELLRDARVAAPELGSLQELNGLPAPLREGLYGRLIPLEVCARVGVDRATGLNAAGHRLLRIFAPPEQSWARVELRASRDDRDPIVLVDIEVGPFGVPELSFVQITDPRSPRFAIDRDEDGQDTLFGTVTRNLQEEGRAAAAGLAPGQVRPGLRMLGRVLDAMDDFCRLFGKELSSWSRSSTTPPSSTSATAATTCWGGKRWRRSTRSSIPGAGSIGRSTTRRSSGAGGSTGPSGDGAGRSTTGFSARWTA